MTAVVTGDDKAGDHSNAEIHTRAIACSECFRELARQCSAENRVARGPRSDLLTDKYSENVTDEQNAEAGRNSSGVPSYRRGTALAELCPDV